MFSARLYGSRSHKTKQLLADLRGEESKEEEVVTKSMPILEGRVGALIESMQELIQGNASADAVKLQSPEGFCPCRSSARRLRCADLKPADRSPPISVASGR